MGYYKMKGAERVAGPLTSNKHSPLPTHVAVKEPKLPGRTRKVCETPPIETYRAGSSLSPLHSPDSWTELYYRVAGPAAEGREFLYFRTWCG